MFKNKKIEKYLMLLSAVIVDIEKDEDLTDEDLMNLMASAVSLACIKSAQSTGTDINAVSADFFGRVLEAQEIIGDLLEKQLTRN